MTERETGSWHRLDIQGLRCVAVVAVVLYHADLPVPCGYLGVDMFFVISGFVITQMLWRERLRSGAINLRRFFARRFWRLYPALSVVVTAVLLASILLQSPLGAQVVTAKTAMGTLLGISNLVIFTTSGGYFDLPAASNPLLNMWSLSVEEQFYAFFAPVFACAVAVSAPRRWRHFVASNRGVACGLAAVGLVSLFAAFKPTLGFVPVADPWSLAFFSPMSRAWEFVAGALVGLTLMNGLNGRLVTLAPYCGYLGTASIFVALFALGPPGGSDFLHCAVAVVGTSLMLIAGSTGYVTRAGLVTRVLSSAPMNWVGDRSYSLYIWHWPMICFAGLIFPGRVLVGGIAAVSSFGLASLTYSNVEQRFRARRPISKVARPFRAAVGFFVLPLAIAALLLIGAGAKWWIAWPEESGGSTAHVAWKRGCVDNGFEPERCTWARGAPNGSILVAGDSQAYAVADGIIKAGSRLGLSVTVASRSHCPFLGVPSVGFDESDCRKWQQLVLGWALTHRPKIVVIANRGTGYTNPQWGWARLRLVDGRVANSATEATLAWREGLGSVVKELRASGIGVMIVNSGPEGFDPPPPSLLRRFAGLDESQPVRLDATTMRRDRRQAVSVERQVANTTGAEIFDPYTTLCPSGICSLVVEGKPAYMDGWHVSAWGSKLLAPQFTKKIRGMLMPGS